MDLASPVGCVGLLGTSTAFKGKSILCRFSRTGGCDRLSLDTTGLRSSTLVNLPYFIVVEHMIPTHA